jgi:hypothetical protein
MCGRLVQVLTLGGSFSGMVMADKGAEVLAGSSWAAKSGITGQSIKSNDAQGVFRQDNYPWLFAWTADSGLLLL